MGFPDLFRAASELRTRLNQVANDVFNGQESPQGLSAGQALQVIHDLEVWRRGLDGPLSSALHPIMNATIDAGSLEEFQEFIVAYYGSK